MIIPALLLLFLGFYLLYFVSEKNRDKKAKLTLLRQYKKVTKIYGLVLLVAAFVFFIAHFGFGAGILAGFVSLMTVACLVVLVAPLKIINYKMMLFIGTIAVILQIATY